MRNSAILLLLVWTAVLAAEPRCSILVPQNQTVFNAPNELQALDLSKYFKGFNLDYSLSTNSSEYAIISPFYNSEIIDLPNPVPAGNSNFMSGSTRVALDILTDENLAWQDQGASLIVDSSTSFTVAFAELTANQNLDFKEDFMLKHLSPTNCFDIAMIAPFTAFVDCQILKTDSRNATDEYYIVNRQTKTTTGAIPDISFPETKSTVPLIQIERRSLIFWVMMSSSWLLVWPMA